MEISAACPACGGLLSAWRPVRAADPSLGGGSFDLAHCAQCGSAVTLGRAPRDLYDRGAYGPGVPRLHTAARPLLSLFDQQRLRFVRSLTPPPARLVDAGAGRGRFVAAAQASGYDAFGIEPSLRGVEAAAAAGSPVRRADIEDAGVETGSVDVVSLWHVLEHLDDPGAALSRISSWLRPGGGLLVGVPNLDSFQARLGGPRWFHLDVPRHRVHFTLRGMVTLLRAHGFAVLRVRHLLLEHNWFGMWQTAVNRVTREPSYIYNLLKRNAPARSPDLAVSAAALPLLPVAALAELIAGLARRGGTVAVLARRDDLSGRGPA